MSCAGNARANRRRHDRSDDEARAFATAPAARHGRILNAAVRRGPGNRRHRAEAFVAYVRALPAEADSIGKIRAHFAEDLHVLFEALLAERRRRLDHGRP